MNPKTCTECKLYPVRENGSYLCRKCYNEAMKDLFRSDEPWKRKNES